MTRSALFCYLAAFLAILLASGHPISSMLLVLGTIEFDHASEPAAPLIVQACSDPLASAELCGLESGILVPDGFSVLYGDLRNRQQDAGFSTLVGVYLGPGGDVDGDGLNDFAYESVKRKINSTPGDPDFATRTTHVVFGSLGFNSTSDRRILNLTLEDEGAGHYGLMADLTGDERAELVVTGIILHPDVAGFVRVFSLNDSDVFELLYEYQILEPWGFFKDVAVGDFDNDGYQDVALCLSDDSPTGTVFVVFGAADASGIETLIVAPPFGDYDRGCGPWSLSLGDVTGDGMDDLLVAQHSYGYFLFYMGNDARSFEFYLTFSGPEDTILFPDKIGVVGDINCDGIEDVVADDAKKQPPWISYGTNQASLLQEWSPLDTVPMGQGAPVSRAGDVNGDGFDDFLVGYNNHNAEINGTVVQVTGGVYVFFGSPEGIMCSSLITGSYSGQLFGFDLAPLGDIDGDGRDEFAVTDSPCSGKGLYVLGYDPTNESEQCPCTPTTTTDVPTTSDSSNDQSSTVSSVVSPSSSSTSSKAGPFVAALIILVLISTEACRILKRKKERPTVPR